jgi:hypothetical protein
MENDETRVINCSYDDKNGLKKYKDLLTIIKVLNSISADAITSYKQYSLTAMRQILSKHKPRLCLYPFKGFF